MQLRTSPTIKFFHNTFKNKFGFEEYKSLEKPTVFFGLYRPRDMAAVIRHQGIKIIWLAGFDATYENNLKEIKNNPALKGAAVIAESKWIKEDLNKFGIPYRSISLCMDDLYAWKPVPLGDSLYWYNAGSSRYGKKYFDLVRKTFPDLNIITNDSHTIPREKMSDVYAKCFAGVRPIEHDGASQTVAEMALMGRMSIYNGKGPFSMPFNDENGLLEAIRQLRGGYNHKLVAKRSRGYFIENERKWTSLVLELCGTDELDICGIFNENRGRCGSIFRLMRKSVVDQMPDKFGTDQFERGYISNQLSKMGLKELITSKNSGFIVSEFKGKGNKGYPEGFKDFHTYDKRY